MNYLSHAQAPPFPKAKALLELRVRVSSAVYLSSMKVKKRTPMIELFQLRERLGTRNEYLRRYSIFGRLSNGHCLAVHHIVREILRIHSASGADNT